MASEEIVDFTHAVPPPLNSLILQSADSVAWLRWALGIASWRKGHRVQSWLLLAAWWACCILGPFVIKYALPAFFIFPLALRMYPKKTKASAQLSTENTFQEAVSNLLAIQQSLLWPQILFPTLPPLVALRVLGIIVPPYWIVSRFIGVRFIVAILGSIALCCQADWAHKIAQILWKSAWFRAGVAYTWSRISGLPYSSKVLSTKAVSHHNPTRTTELRLLFTIFENQRWWMGLDWTAALLPAERPSWSTANLQPVTPPASFSLPEPTISYIPHPDKPNFRIQRKATWRWEDMEWKVSTNKYDAESPSPSRSQRTQKPLASPPIDSISPDSAKDMMAYDSTRRLRDRLKEKMNDSPQSNLEQPLASEEPGPSPQSEDESPKLKIPPSGLSTFTDADGWIFGDNKWENTSDRGGMGKYTRSRRWMRIAVLREEAEEVGPGIMGVVRAQPAQTVVSTGVPQPTTAKTVDKTSPLPSPSSPSEVGTTASDRLRQRLQAAMRRESRGG